MNNITLTQLIELNRRASGYAPDPSIQMPGTGADEAKQSGLSKEPLTLSKEQIDYIKRSLDSNRSFMNRLAMYQMDKEVTPVGN